MKSVLDQISRREWIAGVVAASVASAQSRQAAFLTATENSALIAVGERIIPGSSAAQCNQVIDLVLSIETPETQKGFRAALQTFIDAGFEALPAARQDALLQGAAFECLKEWVADAYWTSKAGHAELGYTGQMAWPEYAPRVEKFCYPE